jgi:hypothetical protein
MYVDEIVAVVVDEEVIVTIFNEQESAVISLHPDDVEDFARRLLTLAELARENERA